MVQAVCAVVAAFCGVVGFLPRAAAQGEEVPYLGLGIDGREVPAVEGRDFEIPCRAVEGKAHVAKLTKRLKQRFESPLFSFDVEGDVTIEQDLDDEMRSVTISAKGGIVLNNLEMSTTNAKLMDRVIRSKVKGGTVPGVDGASAEELPEEKIGGFPAKGMIATGPNRKKVVIRNVRRALFLGHRGIIVEWYGPIDLKATADRLGKVVTSSMRFVEPKVEEKLAVPAGEGKVRPYFDLSIDGKFAGTWADGSLSLTCPHQSTARHECVISTTVPIVNGDGFFQSPECSFEKDAAMTVTRSVDEKGVVSVAGSQEFSDDHVVRLSIRYFPYQWRPDDLAGVLIKTETDHLRNLGIEFIRERPKSVNWGGKAVDGFELRYGEGNASRWLWFGAFPWKSGTYYLRCDFAAASTARSETAIQRIQRSFLFPFDAKFGRGQSPETKPVR